MPWQRQVADVAGSSPLTRGKLLVLTSRFYLVGLIPAHAGKTRRATKRAARSRAHPRSRGENAGLGLDWLGLAGSSPLTRGKYPGIHQRNQLDGLIPAHAGKMQRAPLGSPPPEAHPRSRGENAIASALATFVAGSSPLTRGKLRIGCVRGTCVGLIPAHAGKTISRGRSPSPSWAHPRSRGENLGVHFVPSLVAGSSPLTRGKLALRSTTSLRRGLIPAHAGKTVGRYGDPHQRWAHPRSRGENSLTTRSRSFRGGSSPLTRGKHETTP